MIAKLTNAVTFFYAFAKTRWGYKFKNREALVKYQKKKLEKFSKLAFPKAAFYKDSAGRDFGTLPLVGKPEMLAHFEQFNTRGITLKNAQEIALRSENERDFKSTLAENISVGLSSGTSGKRSVFLTSESERHIWAGIILGRMLSRRALNFLCNPFRPPLRVALFLRANNHLYGTVNGIRLQYRYFDLLDSLDKHLEAVTSFSPDILIAPPSILHQLAKADFKQHIKLSPMQVISVAEVLEPDDIDIIFATWKVNVQQLYQCTEGFLGYTCRSGNLHLNEEFVHFEPVWQDARQEYFSANITDFTRQTQIFARFAMDDLLHIDRSPCACGSHSMKLKSIDGRCDDVLWLPQARTGEIQPVFPDQLRRAMLLAHDHFDEYRIEQNEMVLHIAVSNESEMSITKNAVEKSLGDLWEKIGVMPPTANFLELSYSPSAIKRRRIRCLKRPARHLSFTEMESPRA